MSSEGMSEPICGPSGNPPDRTRPNRRQLGIILEKQLRQCDGSQSVGAAERGAFGERVNEKNRTPGEATARPHSKYRLSSMAWMPFWLLTSCVTRRSAASEQSM